ncbi:MAG: FmdB family transcriptional regulator [Actinobacteria bacterium]|nr:FmdB family transcriptional regulator [Actinomycetota bacterium]
MPTYAYRCSDCDHAFDIYQAFTDDTLTDCPKCGGKLRKVFGKLGVTFNGSGFYRTDSRAGSGSGSDSGKPSSSSESSGSSKSGGSSTPSGSGGSGGSGASTSSSASSAA